MSIYVDARFVGGIHDGKVLRVPCDDSGDPFYYYANVDSARPALNAPPEPTRYQLQRLKRPNDDGFEFVYCLFFG